MFQLKNRYYKKSIPHNPSRSVSQYRYVQNYPESTRDAIRIKRGGLNVTKTISPDLRASGCGRIRVREVRGLLDDSMHDRGIAHVRRERS